MTDLLRSGALLQPDWPAPPNVRALVTTRDLPGNSQPPYDRFNLGLHSGEEEAVVLSNRALLERACGLPSSPRWLRQVHGTACARFAAASLASIEPVPADAAVASGGGVVLAVLTADCLPLLLAAEDGSEIAVAHAGWRGLSAGVIQACVRSMQAEPARLIAWLGPAIGAESYEVGDEVRSAFVASAAEADAAFAPTRPGHWHCDLYTLARQCLSGAGVPRIFGGGFDTFADTRFYSYRRSGARSGRFASLIWLNP